VASGVGGAGGVAPGICQQWGRCKWQDPFTGSVTCIGGCALYNENNSDRRGFENSIGLHCKMHDVPVVTIGILSSACWAISAMAAKSSRVSFPDQIEAGTMYQP
jgi:hypothetical protein